MSTPSWIKDVHRTKVVGNSKPNENERLRQILKELRLRYIKILGDNINLRKALASKKRRRNSKYFEQENEIAPGTPPGIVPDDYQDDVYTYTERLRRKEDW